MTTWNLCNAAGKPLSQHPNTEGAKLAALFHVSNGDKIYWHDTDGKPVDVAAFYGTVKGERRFIIQRYE